MVKPIACVHARICYSVSQHVRHTVLHQALACGWAVIVRYSLLANARQIYGAKSTKSGCVIAWKLVMTVEVAGLGGSRC